MLTGCNIIYTYIRYLRSFTAYDCDVRFLTIYLVLLHQTLARSTCVRIIRSLFPASSSTDRNGGVVMVGRRVYLKYMPVTDTRPNVSLELCEFNLKKYISVVYNLHLRVVFILRLTTRILLNNLR